MAAIIKASSAGQLQGLLDFLRPRAMARHEVQIVSFGVGNLSDSELDLANAAASQVMGIP